VVVAAATENLGFLLVLVAAPEDTDHHLWVKVRAAAEQQKPKSPFQQLKQSPSEAEAQQILSESTRHLAQSHHPVAVLEAVIPRRVRLTETVEMVAAAAAQHHKAARFTPEELAQRTKVTTAESV